MVGKETARRRDETRNLFDTTLSLALSPKFSVMGNFDYGKEGDVKWWGLAAYAKLQATPNWALVGRYEYLDDSEGGFMILGTKGQTLTAHQRPPRSRADSRPASSTGPTSRTRRSSPKDDGSTKKSQTTLTVGLVYGFGGKI